MMPKTPQPKTSRAGFAGVIPVFLRGGKGYWVLAASLYAVAYSLWIFFKWTDPAYEALIATYGYLPLGIFAVICAAYAVSQKHLDPATRRAWMLIALGVVSLSLGDILYTIMENTSGVGFPDIPDFFYFAYYLLAFSGLILIPTEISDPSQRKTWKLDLAVMIISATSVLWYFVIEPTAVAGGNDWVTAVFAGAYPAMDMLLLASIASILYRRSEINTRQALYILVVGLLLYVSADIAYAWQVLTDTYASGNWVDLLWSYSYLFIGLAALRQASLYLSETDDGARISLARQAYLAPFLALSASVAISLYASSTGVGAGLRTNGLIIGTAAAVFLTVIRQVLTIRENGRLVDDLNLASDQLRANARVLEERVRERTNELEQQTNRLRLAAQIARDAASAKDTQSLFEQATKLILDRFNLYHTAIYLIDQKREYAILASSPTDAGRQMIANGYKLKVGDAGAGIVGRVAASGDPRIVSEKDTQSVHIDNPLLPNTRSEMALPLKTENRTIGVLDVHSDQSQAFTQDDVAIVQILADQLAIAVERIQLLQQVEENLRELEQVYGQSTAENWKRFSESGLVNNAGYRFDNVRIHPVHTPPEFGSEAMQSGKPVIRAKDANGSSGQTSAAIPVKLRGQSIGVVTVKLREGHDAGTINTIQQAVDRLAASLESARLFEEARSRADREQAIAQVTSAISSAADYEAVLRTTVEEIGKSLGEAEVKIQILGRSGQAEK